MAIKKLTPYLNFDGNAARAIELYQSALGAKLEGPIGRFGDAPGIDCGPGDKDRVMHAALRVGEGLIMISDGTSAQPVTQGNNVHVVVDFDDVSEMSAKFDALAVGGKVSMPLNDTFWGARFGMLTDAYGINWMFNCELKK
jgi:PhnB protein